MATSKEIWAEISKKDIDVFSVSNKKVSDYFNFIEVDPVKCYLTCTASAALPALETSLGKAYTCSLVEKYIVVEKNNV